MGLFDLFRRRESAQPDVSAWWQAANALTTAPTADGVARLKATTVNAGEAPDLAEAQDEMLAGLDALIQLAQSPLPILDTQHRVIGADTCHYMAPASLIDQVDSGGKVFVTSARIIFAAGTVVSWPWHQVARISRDGRDLLIELKGRPAVRLRLNTYEGALVIAALAGRLSSNRP
jgi:hypothetical protein